MAKTLKKSDSRENRDRLERGDRYTDRQRDDYDHDERHKDGYNRDRYEGDYSPKYDWRRDDRRQLEIIMSGQHWKTGKWKKPVG